MSLEAAESMGSNDTALGSAAVDPLLLLPLLLVLPLSGMVGHPYTSPPLATSTKKAVAAGKLGVSPTVSPMLLLLLLVCQ
jgi:hypothetical protein